MSAHLPVILPIEPRRGSALPSARKVLAAMLTSAGLYAAVAYEPGWHRSSDVPEKHQLRVPAAAVPEPALVVEKKTPGTEARPSEAIVPASVAPMPRQVARPTGQKHAAMPLPPRRPAGLVHEAGLSQPVVIQSSAPREILRDTPDARDPLGDLLAILPSPEKLPGVNALTGAIAGLGAKAFALIPKI